MSERNEDDKPEPVFKVEDRRHWARAAEADADATEAEPAPASTHPTVVEEYRRRAENAEQKLLDYISAFKQAQTEHEQFRERLARDVDRKVALQFGALVGDLLDSLDDLNLALAHVEGGPQAAPLAEGVRLARDRFLSALEKSGVVEVELNGAEFDPNVAEAVRVDPVDDPTLDGKVTETLRAGFRLGDRVIRPARVAVGRHGKKNS